MQRKNIALWTLYDFANSIAVIVFFLYFSQWLVVEKGVADIWYNLIFTISSVLLLCTAPVFGSLADRTGRQQVYLNRITLCAFACFLGASLVALFFSGQVMLAALFFLLANYFYQFSFAFYNALLHSIALPEEWGIISGIGQAGNWLGQIAGLLITLPLATGALYLFGAAGRAQTFLPATLLFILLSLPMLLWFRLPTNTADNRAAPTPMSWRQEYRSQWQQFKTLTSDRNMGLFLLSYFFFNDAIITTSNNFPIFLQNVFAVSDTVKSMILAGVLVTSVIGALCSGWVTDRIGMKKALALVLGSWILVFPLMGMTTYFPAFIVLCVLMGFLYGAIWTVTRVAMTALCPKDQLNFGFSFYTLAERVSTFIGPLSWGLITLAFHSLGPVRYRIAIIAMALFVAVGMILLRHIEIPQRQS